MPALFALVFSKSIPPRELRKQGVRIKLREQPFQLLLLLLAHPNELVSRDELEKQLWPGNTFLGSDQGLNKAVNHLREALGDSVESPRFIETLPKRGYRFIASVNAGSPNGQPTRETQDALAELPDRSAEPNRLRRACSPSGLKPQVLGRASVDGRRCFVGSCGNLGSAAMAGHTAP